MDEHDLRGMRMVLAGVLAAIVVGGAVDLILDAPKHWLTPHVIYEVLLIGGALAASVWLWLAWRWRDWAGRWTSKWAAGVSPGPSARLPSCCSRVTDTSRSRPRRAEASARSDSTRSRSTARPV